MVTFGQVLLFGFGGLVKLNWLLYASGSSLVGVNNGFGFAQGGFKVTFSSSSDSISSQSLNLSCVLTCICNLIEIFAFKIVELRQFKDLVWFCMIYHAKLWALSFGHFSNNRFGLMFRCTTMKNFETVTTKQVLQVMFKLYILFKVEFTFLHFMSCKNFTFYVMQKLKNIFLECLVKISSL